MMPASSGRWRAALLGRWFWWPVRVRQRPIPQKFGDENTRQLSLF
jgi:putative drug exporter of the RND superfamily